MKKILGIFFASFFLQAAFALEVDQAEIQEVSPDSIQFENYGGPHAVIETAAAITGIGVALGEPILQDVQTPTVVFPEGKYTLIHSVDSENPNGLDADILLLNDTAGVDHIRNLRRIISGFLQTAYAYDANDAETLAIFVTVYNAVYRGNLDAFRAKYKTSVIENLNEESVGLSTFWQDWAGKTQIVIPLSDVQGGLSTVDTTEISDEKVIEALKQEGETGTSARENLADLKKRESEDASVRAQEAQKTAAQEKNAAAKTQDPEEKAQAKERAQEAQKNAAQEQQTADRKNLESQTEKQVLAREQSAANANPVDTSNYVTGLFLVDEAKNLYSLITVDGASGEIVKKSPATQIRSANLYKVSNVSVEQDEGSSILFEELYVALCGINDGKSAVKLCLIDSSKLEIQKESEETLSENAHLEEINGNFYTVIQNSGANYVAIYDKNLNLRTKSSIAVRGGTPLNQTEKGLLVTGTNGNPILLNLTTLDSVWQENTASNAEAEK